jgi:hypothetical protein
VHHELYIATGGEVAGKLLLSGVNPELDACVSEAVAGWNFGASDSPSFVKLKLVWTDPSKEPSPGEQPPPGEETPPIEEPPPVEEPPANDSAP